MSTLIEIQKQIAELQAQEQQIKASEFSEKLAEVKATMAAYGITIAHLQGKQAKEASEKTKSKNPAPAKYAGPNGEVWSGRGLMPRWLAALVSDGHAKEEYSITSAV